LEAWVYMDKLSVQIAETVAVSPLYNKRMAKKKKIREQRFAARQYRE
jgi:hypothetical protein